MKPRDLHSIWSMPDNSRLTAKQYSFRLPVHVAARIAALCEMYPGRTRTQIVGDLLSAALDQVELQFPEVRGPFFTSDDERAVNLYEDVGPGSRYRGLANKHFKELEQELGNDEPPALFAATVLIEAPIEDQ